ncbi:uncharacterized protein [Henckelia pumila]|uniref:uncharacterized protein n=1 Tax=Henckelia pumila TaxID=405737 RepID=UPI003C6E3F09
MDFGREGGSMIRPPLLDGTNYPYWKSRMRAFVKSIIEKAWRSIVTGWKPPMDKNSEGKETTPKKEDKWTTEEERLGVANAKALNAIFIAGCSWNILKTAYEGTAAVKVSKLQILATKFEDLKMEEDETINDFNTKLCDITNKAFALDEKYSEAKLVQKTLRSLPKRFDIKVAAIEEAKDIDGMRLDELTGSLLTFEMKFKQKRKYKGITLKA